MKFDLFALPTIPGTLEERKALRPIGRNNERYQQMLDELRQMVIMADDMGFEAFSTTEHHFHSEGFEASVAGRTDRISFGFSRYENRLAFGAVKVFLHGQ